MDSKGQPRLLLITTSPASLWVFFRDQAKYLRERGFDVTAISAPGTELSEFEDRSGCKVLPIAMERTISPIADLKALFKLVVLIRRLSPDIVHTHTPKAGLLGTLAAKMAGVRVRVHTYHGLRSETLTGWKRFLVENTERATSTFSTASLAVSLSLRDRLIERRICSTQSIKVLGYGGCAGVDLEEFNPEGCKTAAVDFRCRHRMPEDALIVTYVGRIAREKGVEVLAEAWKLLEKRNRNIRLLLCGPLDETDAVSPNVLRAWDENPNVIVVRGLNQEISIVLGASDICVLPSFREGLGVAALEASAMRVPVIASNVTGLLDAVEHESTGLLVPPKDAVSLVNAIQYLIDHPELRRVMGNKGREFVEQRFDRKQIFEALFSEYKRLLQMQIKPKFAFTLKRLMDLTGALIALLFAAPVLLVAAIAIKLIMGSPILLRQERAGRDGKHFFVLKFRTMTEARDSSGRLYPDAERLTPLGKWLRAASIDELPQLWNVLRGEMSLVGPRPLVASYLSRYNEFQARRHEVLPGITGWTQVQGRNGLTWDEKFALDVWYVENQSIWLDIRILALTVKKVIVGEGVTSSGSVSMPEFMGERASSHSS